MPSPRHEESSHIKQEPQTPEVFRVPHRISSQKKSSNTRNHARQYQEDDSPDELATPEVSIGAIHLRRRRPSGDSIGRSADEDDISQYEAPDDEDDEIPEEREDPSPSPRTANRANKRRKTSHGTAHQNGTTRDIVRYDPRLASDPTSWYYRTREDFGAASERTKLRIHHVSRMLFEDDGELAARACTACQKKRPRSN